MELRVLGPIEVRHAGSPVRLRAAKPRELLALLAIRPNQPLPAEELIEQLWEGDAPPSAATALRVHVGRLRQLLELDRPPNAPSTRLPSGPHGYRLCVEPDELDSQRFERLVLLARDATAGGDPAAAVPQLTAALDLWRGPALVDVQHLSAARAEITRLDELRAVAIEDLAEARLALGEHVLAVDLVTAALEEFPLRERLAESLMLALYRSGRQAEALRAYQLIAQRLDEQLGVVPSEHLRRLEEDILLQRPHLDFVHARATATADSRASVRFVGRRHELSQLLHLNDVAGADAPRLVLVDGPAGIGKTTLVREYCRRTRHQGCADPIVGVCTPDPGDDYAPVAQIIAAATDRAGRGEPRARGTGDAPASEPAAEILSRFVRDVEAERFRFFEAVAHTLAAVRDSTRVVVIEDLHWARRPLLLLLRHLLRHPALDGMCVIATRRDDEIGLERDEMVMRLAPADRLRHVRLDAFSVHEVRALVRAVAPPEHMRTLVDLGPVLHDVTGGNPLFLRELLRELDEEPARPADPSSLASTLGSLAPEGVRALVEWRLARLTETGRDVVRATAVAGHDVPVEVVAASCGLAPVAALDAIEEALAARLLVEDARAGDRYGFSHALVRNAVYATIEDTDRRRLHTRVAIALEATGDSSAADLAHHFVSGDLSYPDRAAAYAARAAEDAARAYAYADAAEWYGHAIRLGRDRGIGDSRLGRLELARGEALANDKQLAPARDAYLAAAASARRAGDAELLADVALAANGLWSSPSEFQPVACALLEEALDLTAPHDTPRRVAILNGIASDVYYTDPEREGCLAREALAAADESGEPGPQALARLAIHRWYTHQPEAREQRRDIATEAFALASAAGCPSELRLLVQRALLADLLEHGDLAAFDAELDAYERAAAADGIPRDIYWATALRATQAIMRGDLVVGEQLARGAALRGHELAQPSDGAYLLQRFVVRYQQDRLAEELAALREAGGFGSVFRAGGALAAVTYADLGQPDRAARSVRAVLGPDGTALPRDVFWLAGLALCAEAATRATGASESDVAALVELLERLLRPYGDHVVVFGVGAAVLGVGHHWLGRLAAALGDLAGAIAHFDAARAQSRRIAAPYWAADAAVSAAEVLHRRNRPEDRAVAPRLVHEACTAAHAGGYGRVLARAARLG